MRLRLIIVGFGRLGHACAEAIAECPDIELAGVLRRPESPQTLPGPFRQVPVGAHVRDFAAVHGALLCVPPEHAGGTARELLQDRVPVVECARLEGRAREAHYDAIAEAARHHRVAAVVGAGWDPGMLPLLKRAFEVLVPKGHTGLTERTAASLHHTESAGNLAGVKGALATEFKDADGRLKRLVYVELEKGATMERVRAALQGDSLFAGEDTQLFAVDSVAALEEEGSGILLERRGTARSGAHQNLLLEARFDLTVFAARVMVDGARRLPTLKPGLHHYSLWA
ncbi:MAG: oxidoreductase [Pseudomonadota bacterium]